MPGWLRCSRKPTGFGGFMQRRFTIHAALLIGALGAVAALPLVSAARHIATDATFLARDAHADTAGDLKQTPSPLPSLAPIVKQLRPVVVNINSRFKPRHPRTAQRMPRQRVPVPDDNQNDGSDDPQQQDPTERFFRFFGQPMP